MLKYDGIIILLEENFNIHKNGPPSEKAGRFEIPLKPQAQSIYPSAQSSSASRTPPPAAPRRVLWLRQTNL